MNTDDLDLSLRCVALAAELRAIDDLDLAARQLVLSEAAVLLELVGGVFLEPADPSRN